MAFPTFTIKADWDGDGFAAGANDDITSRVLGMSWARGASFDGARQAPGTCSIRVRNDDGRFSVDNGSSPLVGKLRPGVRVWATATWSAVTYGVFFGRLRRIIEEPRERTVELYCEDPLFWAARALSSVALSTSRSIAAFRGAILDDLSWAAGQRDLAAGIEQAAPITYADRENALGLLEALNQATGTVHFCKPDPAAGTLFKYTTIDRTQLQAGALAETWTQIADASDLDVSDDTIINFQLVSPEGGQVSVETETLEAPVQLPFGLAAGATKTVWLRYTPASGVTVAVEATGSLSTTVTSWGGYSKVVITAGASAVSVTAITVTGKPVVAGDATPVEVTSSTSAADPPTGYGRWDGPDISSRYLMSEAEAAGLGSWVIYRWAAPRRRPTVVRQHELPSQLVRDLGDRVAINVSPWFTSLNHHFITGLTSVADIEHVTLTTTYVLEEAPPLVDIFTIGGTAAQGIGGSAILGY